MPVQSLLDVFAVSLCNPTLPVRMSMRMLCLLVDCSLPCTWGDQLSYATEAGAKIYGSTSYPEVRVQSLLDVLTVSLCNPTFSFRMSMRMLCLLRDCRLPCTWGDYPVQRKPERKSTTPRLIRKCVFNPSWTYWLSAFARQHRPSV